LKRYSLKPTKGTTFPKGAAWQLYDPSFKKETYDSGSQV
jgi:hypothetical protein